MKFFNFKKKSTPQLHVNKRIKTQIEQNYEWLLTNYGYPKNSEIYVFSEVYFPKSFSSKQPNYNTLVEDLCRILNLDFNCISIHLYTDLRDAHWTPYYTEGEPAFAEFESYENQIKIHLAQDVLKHEKRILNALILVLLKIKLSLYHENYSSWEDINELSYIYGTYLGFGALLSENLLDFGTKQTLNWTESWNYQGPFSIHEMSYIIALHYHIAKVTFSEYQPYFFNAIKPHLQIAEFYITNTPPTFISVDEAKASSLFFTAHHHFTKHEYEKALNILLKALPYASNVNLRADIYNNLGYYMSRLSQYEKAIDYFIKALNTDKNHCYADDNLGYCYIKIGALDIAKKHLDKALKKPGNNKAYTYRNFALYYDAFKDLEKTKHYFSEAFNHAKEPVDLLDYYYGIFLLNTGKTATAIQHIERSKLKGEPEGIKKLHELNRL